MILLNSSKMEKTIHGIFFVFTIKKSAWDHVKGNTFSILKE